MGRSSGQHGDSELLKHLIHCFQDGRHGSDRDLQAFQLTSPPEPYVRLYRNAVGLSSGQHGDSELLKYLIHASKMVVMVAIMISKLSN